MIYQYKNDCPADVAARQLLVYHLIGGSMELTVDMLARSLVSVGYDEGDIRATLVQRFPDADVDQAIADAREWEAGIELGLAEGQERDERAAQAAEHDLSKTNREE